MACTPGKQRYYSCRIASKKSKRTLQKDDDAPTTPVICKKGYWTYTTNGGILEVYPGVNTLIKKGDLVARMRNIFGMFAELLFVRLLPS